MNDQDERLIRMETKLDLLVDWAKGHRTLHTSLGIGLFLLLVTLLAGTIL